MAAAGHKAATMTLNQFKEKFKELARKCADPGDFEINPSDPAFDPIKELYHIIREIRSRHGEFDKDLAKIEFDFENFECDASTLRRKYKPGNLLGFRMIGELPILGCYAGGDWECPLFFAIYFDGNGALRGYVPTDGNPHNVDKKSAFGNHPAHDVDWDGYVKGDPRFDGCDEEVCARVYGAKPDAWQNDALGFDWPKVEADIRAHISAV